MSDITLAHKGMEAVEKQLIETVVMDQTDRHMLIASAFQDDPNNPHILFEGDPGVGKTHIAKSLAAIIGGEFARLQFTPDLRPTEVTGGMVPDMMTREMFFKPGRIFANVVLADEINRSMPKTQSALLESMEERQVSASDDTHPLPKPFIVLGTRNYTDDEEGTTELPRGTLDRWNISIDFPPQSVDTMMDVITLLDKEVEPRQAIDIGAGEFQRIQESMRTVTVEPELLRRAAAKIVELRDHPRIDPAHTVLSGTRALRSFKGMTQAYAALKDTGIATVEHVNAVAPYVLGHRISLTHTATQDEGLTSRSLVKQVFNKR